MNTIVNRLEAISQIHEGALKAVRAYFERNEFHSMSVPTLVGITGACENIATLFTVEGNRRVHLTQTGQLALEQALQFAPAVCCVTKSFRTDCIDARHLSEFTLIEEEVSCAHNSVGIDPESYNADVMFEVLLGHIENVVREIVSAIVLTSCKALNNVGADVGRLQYMLANTFQRISYTDSIDLLNSRDNTRHLVWGDDLKADHELMLIKLVAEANATEPLPLFVTHYPKDIKFFNMKVCEWNDQVVYSADLLLPGVGEAVGAAVREHDYNKLVSRLTSSTMFMHIQEQGLATLDDFQPYLQVVQEHRILPHCGFGIGLERLVQYMVNESDIRECSVDFLLNCLMGFVKELENLQKGSNSPGF